jgi:hypothetical protein
MRYIGLIVGLILLASGVTGRILPKNLPLKNARTGNPAVIANRLLYSFFGLIFTLNALYLILVVHKR